MMLLTPIVSSIGMELNGGTTSNGGINRKSMTINGLKAGISADTYLPKVYAFLSAVADVIEYQVLRFVVTEKNELSNE